MYGIQGRNKAVVTLAGIGLVSAGLVLSACSSSPDDQAVLQQAVETTIATGSAQLTSTASTSGVANAPDSPDDLGGLTLTGTYDFETNSFEGSYTIQIPGGPQQSEIIIFDGYKYVEVPKSSKGRWLKTSWSPEQDIVPSMASPQKTLAQIAELDGVQQVAEETVDDVSTTKYTGNLATLPKQADVGLPGGQLAVASATASVWVDDDGRIARSTSEYKAAEGAEGASVQEKMQFSDFGIDLDIEVPSDGDVLVPGGLTQTPAQ